MTRRGAAWKPARFPAGCALIVHREHGPVLFDTGYAGRFVAATDPFPARLYRWLTPVSLPAGCSAVEQLAALGIAADDVRTVVERADLARRTGTGWDRLPEPPPAWAQADPGRVGHRGRRPRREGMFVGRRPEMAEGGWAEPDVS